MKSEPQSLTVDLRHAAHRIHRAAWMIDTGINWPALLGFSRSLAGTREDSNTFLFELYGV